MAFFQSYPSDPVTSGRQISSSMHFDLINFTLCRNKQFFFNVISFAPDFSFSVDRVFSGTGYRSLPHTLHAGTVGESSASALVALGGTRRIDCSFAADERYGTNSASCRRSAAGWCGGLSASCRRGSCGGLCILNRPHTFALRSSACQLCLQRPRHADHARDARWGDLCFVRL